MARLTAVRMASLEISGRAPVTTRVTVRSLWEKSGLARGAGLGALALRVVECWGAWLALLGPGWAATLAEGAGAAAGDLPLVGAVEEVPALRLANSAWRAWTLEVRLVVMMILYLSSPWSDPIWEDIASNLAMTAAKYLFCAFALSSTVISKETKVILWVSTSISSLSESESWSLCWSWSMRSVAGVSSGVEVTRGVPERGAGLVLKRAEMPRGGGGGADGRVEKGFVVAAEEGGGSYDRTGRQEGGIGDGRRGNWDPPSGESLKTRGP